MRLVKAYLGVAALLVMAGVAQAEPLNLKHVSANAGWLGHVDFDAVRNSTVAQKMVKRHMEQHKQTDAQLKMLEGLTGLNLLTDLHGLTFYGPQIGKHHAVVILHAKMNRELLQNWAERIPKRETSKHGDHSIQSWKHEHHGRTHVVSSAWHGQDRLVVASGEEDLKAALDVIDGKASSVGADAPLAGNVPDGTTVLFRAVGISKIECKEPLVKQTESFRFVAGEHNGQSFHRTRIVMNNAETAGQMKEVAEGLRALVALHCRSNETGKRLVSGSEIKLEDKTLTMLWSASADDVWTVTEAHIKIFEAHMAKRREHRKNRAGHGHHKEGHGHKPDAPQPKKSSDDDF